MEFHNLDADVQAFILKGIEAYGIVDTPGNYAWSTPLIMKYGVELEYEDFVITEEDLVSTDFVHNAAMLAKILSIRLLVRKLRIGDIDVPGFEAAFRTWELCPSLKEVRMDIVAQKCEPLWLIDCGVFQSLCSLDLGAGGTEPAYAEDIASYVTENRSLRELTLRTSCGGDEGIAILLEALKVNDTLKRFNLYDMKLTYDNLICVSKMLASNSTLEVVSLQYLSMKGEDKLFNSDQELLGSVFNRLDIIWSWRLPRLTSLTALIREHGCAPRLHVLSIPLHEDYRQFFEALVGATTLRELCLYTIGEIRDACTDGIPYLLKRTASLRKVMISTSTFLYWEDDVIGIIDALKKNRSITKFETVAKELTPRVATSLSELLAVNTTLNDVTIYFIDGSLSFAQVQIVEKVFETNYTLTNLDLGHDEDEDEMGRIGEYMRRNITLENKAAMCVISGVDLSDEASMHALKKVHSGSSLVEKVQMITGKTREEALDDIQRAVARLPV